MLATNGLLSKLKIFAFKIDKNGEETGEKEKFEVMYNPAKFSQTIGVLYHDKKTTGGDATELEFDKTDSGSISFQFFFDATGTSINNSPSAVDARLEGSVHDQIEFFKRITAQRNSDIHQPYKLLLVWGEFYYECRLTSAKVEYQLFAPSGKPLRARVDATFKGDEPKNKEEAKNKTFSADLTHLYLVKTGDDLPEIAKRIYGDQRLYLEIARINNLKNFRKLTPGSELILPPVNKKRS